MRISVIGTGYVGLVSGACFAEIGHDCTCVDIDAAKVERINRGEPPIHENGLEAILKRHIGTRLRATTDLRAAVHGSEITFVAVGTPFDGQRIDLAFVREAARQIGAALRDKNGITWSWSRARSSWAPPTKCCSGAERASASARAPTSASA